MWFQAGVKLTETFLCLVSSELGLEACTSTPSLELLFIQGLSISFSPEFIFLPNKDKLVFLCTGIRGESDAFLRVPRDLVFLFPDWASSQPCIPYPPFWDRVSCSPDCSWRWPWTPAAFTSHILGSKACHYQVMQVPQLFLYADRSSPFQVICPLTFSPCAMYYIALIFLPLSSHLKEKGFICIEVPVIEGGISVSVQNSEYIGFLAERVMWVRINISDWESACQIHASVSLHWPLLRGIIFWVLKKGLHFWNKLVGEGLGDSDLCSPHLRSALMETLPDCGLERGHALPSSGGSWARGSPVVLLYLEILLGLETGLVQILKRVPPTNKRDYSSAITP